MQPLPRIALWLAFAGVVSVVGLLVNRFAGPHWYPGLYVPVTRVAKISSLCLFCLAALLATVHWRMQDNQGADGLKQDGGRSR